MAGTFVESEGHLRQMLQCIADINTHCEVSSKPLIFIDLEGVNLSRHGSVAIMQLVVPPMKTAYLIDVHVLKETTFHTQGPDGITLKEILESNEWAKVFFDVRNDSDALFSHFGINLSAVIDIQVLEYATRRKSVGFVNGLARCIEHDLPMSYSERHQWKQSKDAGKRLFVPEMGGSYEVFLQRPLSQPLLEYCTQDIVVMPRLLMVYGNKIRGNPGLAHSVHEAAVKRIELSQQPDYNPQGRHKAVGPSLRRQSGQPLLFPTNIVCSGELDKLCNIDGTSM